MLRRRSFPGRRIAIACAASAAVLLAALFLSGCTISCTVGEAQTTSTAAAGTTTVASQTTTESATTTSTPETSTTTEPAVSSSSSEASTTSSSAATTTTTGGPTTPSLKPVKPTLTSLKPLSMWTRYENDDDHLAYKGVTVEVYDDVASGGSFIELRDGAKLAFTYEGTQMRIVAMPFRAGGIAVVTVDGHVLNVDLYADVPYSDMVSTVVWTGPMFMKEKHTVMIENKGLKNGASAGTAIRIDAVDVIGTLM